MFLVISISCLNIVTAWQYRKLRARVVVVVQASRSAIKYEPADFVTQLLVVKHEIPDFAWKLCTLPFALKATSFFSPTVKRRRTRGLDRVGRSTERVCGDMRHHPRLPAAYAACRAAPFNSLATAMAWPPAARVWDIVISPRVHARANSMARRGRPSLGCISSNKCNTCCAQSAAHIASR